MPDDEQWIYTYGTHNLPVWDKCQDCDKLRKKAETGFENEFEVTNKVDETITTSTGLLKAPKQENW